MANKRASPFVDERASGQMRFFYSRRTRSVNHSVVPSDQPKEVSPPAPVAEQDLYGLLGLAPFEPNPDVISTKVRELMREVRKYQVGPYAARTQTRMEELAAATAFLLDPQRKQSYDEDLRRQYGMPPISVASTYAAPTHESSRIEPAGVVAARSAIRWQRWTLLLVVLCVIVMIGWGFRLLAPSISGQTKPATKTSSDSAPVARSSPAAAGQTARADTPLPNRGTGKAKRNPPLVASPEDAVASAPNSDTRPAAAAATREIGSGRSDSPASLERALERIEAGLKAVEDPNKGPFDTAPVDRPHAAPPPPSSQPEPARQRPDTRHSPTTKKTAGEQGLHLSPADVLRELRDLRLKRSPAQRLANNPRSFGVERVVELVKYARSAFGNDRRYQRQLDQEVVALKRVYPQLREMLPDPPR
jgi:hypothetical protein